ncbi:MAG: ABC-F family ATP-binding cassette domain-containing protein [Alphaproteobacteria bacterium]|jgi:ATP-binding cassette subfamily F protein 3
MLKVANLTYRIGPRVLFERASVTVNEGHKVGLVGRNGTGKTTLLRLITGALEADGGDIEVPGRWRIGITTQEAPASARSLIDTVLDADGELRALTAEAESADDPVRIAEIHTRLDAIDAHTATARAARILAGLGFDETAQQRPCREFSGGWRMRVALAALLFTRPDLLLLDEPTNHLDLEATIWLEEYLRHYPGTILIVSHDRNLLNRVVGEIVHLENGKLTLYSGGYDRFERTRRERLEQDARARVKQEAQRKHLQSFVDRFRAKATKARQAQSRLKMLARMEPIPEHREEGSVTFHFPEPEELAPPLINIDAVDLGYDGVPVLRNIRLRLDADDRIALLGANGNGKSTLIKLFAGRLAPLTGEATRSRKLRVGYFAQHQAEEFDLGETPIQALARRMPDARESIVRAHLGRFGLGQQRAETKIGDLSGGEKARLLFALMTLDKPHILLLDEPTNHLDIDSRQALIQALAEFSGAVVIVSHDPHIVELTADRLLLVADGGVKPYDGDIDDYRRLLLGQRKAAEPADNAVRGERREDRRDDRRAAAARRRELAPLRDKTKTAEKLLDRLTDARERLNAALADPKTHSGNGAVVVELQKQLAEVDRQIVTAEETWLTLQERLESLQAAQ